MTNAPLIQVHHLSKRFGTEQHPVFAVQDVSFSIHAGETLGLVGESGSGKSTIGRALLRLIEPTAGQVMYRGTDIVALKSRQMRSLRSKLQMIFQDPFASLNPKLTVYSTLAEAINTHGLAKSTEQCRTRVHQLLALVGLRAEHAQRYPHEFSGGQRQRIGIARALAVEPEFIVADEPLAALDVSIQAQVVNLLMDLRERLKLSMLFISHDLDVVEHVCDRVVVLYLGRVMEVANTEQLFRTPRHPYTRALLAASPKPDPTQRAPHIALIGEIPSATNPPSGCVFRTRCPHAQAICEQSVPALHTVADQHQVACVRLHEIDEKHAHE
jgi:peptide/nickel transport system ATP-binding protein